MLLTRCPETRKTRCRMSDKPQYPMCNSFNPRSGCQTVAWGGAKRNPRNTNRQPVQPATPAAATLGFRSRSTPGYPLTPTPSAEESVRA
jgi:hypothetical protein